MVASVRSGRRSLRPRARSSVYAWGVVTSCVRCRSMKRTAGVSAVSGTTTWSSQTFSNIVLDMSARDDRPRGRHVDIVEPAVLVLRLALHEAEVGRLQFRRDGSTLAVADLDRIDRADGGDLGRSAREKQFVGHVEHLARDC